MSLLFFLFSVLLGLGLLSGLSGYIWWRKHSYVEALQYYNNAVDHLSKGENVKAMNNFREALQRQGDFPEARYGLGLAYLKQERYRDSLPLLQQAAQDCPYDASVFSNLAWAYLNAEELENAESALKKAQELKPEIKETDYIKACVAQERGDTTTAIASCRHVLTIDRNYFPAEEKLKELSEIRDDIPLDIESLQNALENVLENVDPQDTEFLIEL
ncbi:hypothetical protein CSB45_10700 [candidate division KSB3 bacterium]|uniref:Uncharacterized protein n=1 Tax=candidate division KSB3 bacterium TaxID=2044937 RepID=A0A2G6E4G9_9BACT|nr:MAG: hypothetical protein CSB45_10700 [candidate division KSB3 bacterium]PIE29123.1 MAG: hypothetical protein CSA57_09925 [candidate division KSB3 bacterium]